MKTKKTETANEVHQLLITPSRHLYFNKQGRLKVQQKPMKIDINSAFSSKREHLVFYVMQDKFSGNSAFIITTSYHLFPLADFLYYAWGKESTRSFFGLPKVLMIPKILSASEIISSIEKLGIEHSHPSSGFDSGIWFIRVIEEAISQMQYFRSLDDPATLMFYSKFCIPHLRPREEKEKIWKESLKEEDIRLPSREEFFRLFPEQVEIAPGLLLAGENPEEGRIRTQLNLRGRRAFPLMKKFNLDRYNQAEEMMDTLYQHQYKEEMIDLALKALKKSPYCKDAYYSLAFLSKDPREQYFLYNLGRHASIQIIGKENLANLKYEGQYEMRGYMRSLLGMGVSLSKLGRLQWATRIYQKMINLDAEDRTGIRFLLLPLLIALKRIEAAQEIVSKYEKDQSIYMLYNKSLFYFLQGQEKKSSSLEEAYEANPYVPDYLTRKKHVFRSPDSYTLGSEEEAQAYFLSAKIAWEKTDGAVDWVKKELMQDE